MFKLLTRAFKLSSLIYTWTVAMLRQAVEEARMAIAERIEKSIVRALEIPRGGPAPKQLSEAIRYAALPGGARIRPTILMSVAMACGDDRPELSDAAAAALELMHCASLVHDDLPCFDDADFRRGKASVHRA
jgi:geranylgeranyl diphosphate synthase type II